MKKFSSIFRLLLVTVIILSLISCEKNEVNTPVITITQGNSLASGATVETETELVFYIQVTAGDADLKYIDVKELNSGEWFMVRVPLSGKEYNDTLVITAPKQPAECTYEFSVKDQNDQIGTETFDINVTRTPGEIVRYNDITFDLEGNSGYFFFNCNTGQSYSYEEALNHQEEIDIIIAQGYYFASPGSSIVNGGSIQKDTLCKNWEVKNKTYYYQNYDVDVGAGTFNTLDNDSLFYYFGDFTQFDYLDLSIQTLGYSQIYGITTQNGKNGLIYITEFVWNTVGLFKCLTFDIIMQK